MTGKRSAALAELELEEELERLCGPSKCEVCFVPIGSQEAAARHYGGKIHGKKVARWKEQWLAQKKIKLETDPTTGSDCNPGSNGSGQEDHPGDNTVTPPEPVRVEPEREVPVKREVIEDVTPEENTETVPPLAAASLDPKLLDQLDPAAMKKMLNIKKKKRWNDPDEDNADDMKNIPVEDDPYDFSIPVDFDKLLRRCFNPNTGLGYCQICNKLFRCQADIMKHFRSSKHAGKVEVYHELLASEAAVLAGTAQPNPPPHRGFYCELCEADCSSDSQLEQHLCGDRHRTNLRSMERELASDPELDKDINPYNLPELWLRERKHCTLCDVPVTSIRMAKIHFNGRNHRLAAGLNITEASKMAEFSSSGDLRCESCNFSVSTQLELKSHQAGIRHLENDRTKLAVEETGGSWSCHQPTPSDPPKYSVQDPGNGWSGESIGLNPEMMMAGAAGHHGPMGQHPALMMGGPGPMGMYGPMMGGPMMPMMGMPGPVSEKRRYAGVDLENLKCEVCEVKFTSKSQIDVHLQLPAHLEKAKDLPVEEEEVEEPKEPEPFVPSPLTADSISSVRTRSHSVHCPFCKVWFPSITILKYFHRKSESSSRLFPCAFETFIYHLLTSSIYS